jgi:hypothetical protein
MAKLVFLMILSSPLNMREYVFLLESGADKVPVGDDSNVGLSRRVVSVGVNKVLDVCCYDRTLEE